MRGAALSMALVALVASLLALARVDERTALVYRVEPGGAWHEAIAARAQDVPSRVRGADDRWSVTVRSEDAVSTSRNLDWDGTLALYVPCADAALAASGSSAEVRSIVETEGEGPRVRLYEATSTALARTRCVEAPAVLHLVARGAVPSLGEGEAAIVAALDARDLAALATLGRDRPGAPVVIAIRRTVVAEAVLPIETASSSIRLSLVGGDIGPAYADFFSRALQTPPLARLTLISSTPSSPYPEAALAIGLALLLALSLGLASRRVDPSSSPARAIASVAVGLASGALAGWLATASVDAPFVERIVRDLQTAAVEQGLTLAGVAALLAGLGCSPGRSVAMLAALGVALGFGLERGAADFQLLTHDASIPVALLSAIGRAVLACLFGLALASPPPNRVARTTAAWAVAALVHGLALALLHRGT